MLSFFIQMSCLFPTLYEHRLRQRVCESNSQLTRSFNRTRGELWYFSWCFSMKHKKMNHSSSLEFEVFNYALKVHSLTRKQVNTSGTVIFKSHSLVTATYRCNLQKESLNESMNNSESIYLRTDFNEPKSTPLQTRWHKKLKKHPQRQTHKLAIIHQQL